MGFSSGKETLWDWYVLRHLTETWHIKEHTFVPRCWSRPAGVLSHCSQAGFGQALGPRGWPGQAREHSTLTGVWGPPQTSVGLRNLAQGPYSAEAKARNLGGKASSHVPRQNKESAGSNAVRGRCPPQGRSWARKGADTSLQPSPFATPCLHMVFLPLGSDLVHSCCYKEKPRKESRLL